MLKLNGNSLAQGDGFEERTLLILTKSDDIPAAIRNKYALLIDGNESCVEGFGAYITFNKNNFLLKQRYILLPKEMNFFSENDIVRIQSDGRVSSLFRAHSNHNTILLTERCNHYCLMCSQPPKKQDDSILLDDAMLLLDLIPKDTRNIGYSGGEPTLYDDGFIKLIYKTKTSLPNTAVDVLTNGRKFADLDFCSSFSEINHPDCVVGIPLYSDDPVRHDYVVQSEGAFDETIQGIINLKKKNQKVEIRIVLHRQTVDRLVQTCEFIARNLIFVDHVALMGLEMIGFTRANLNTLWIDPYEYKDILSEAVKTLNIYKINNSVYNHQLCIVNEDIHKNYRKSISDWKNEYIEECNLCVRRDDCGGFFSSSVAHKYSENIKHFSS